jgi:hypothetical protein
MNLWMENKLLGLLHCGDGYMAIAIHRKRDLYNVCVCEREREIVGIGNIKLLPRNLMCNVSHEREGEREMERWETGDEKWMNAR